MKSLENIMPGYSIRLMSYLLMSLLLAPIAEPQSPPAASLGSLIGAMRLSGYRPSTKGTDALSPSDYSNLVEYVGTGSVSISAPDAEGLTPGWYTLLRCTIPVGAQCAINAQVGQSIDAQGTLVLSSGDWALLYSDGSNWHTVRASTVAGTAVADSMMSSVSSGNLLTDGDFGAGNCARWRCGTGWTVVNKTVRHTPGTWESLSQSIDVTAGTVYVVSVTHAGRTRGTFRFAIGSTSDAPSNPSDGVQSAILIPDQSGSLPFAIIPSAAYDGTMMSVTVNAMLPGNGPATAVSADASNTSGQAVGNTVNATNALASPRANTPPTPPSGPATIPTIPIVITAQGVNYNTAFGTGALASITTGTEDSAFGAYALTSATSGYANVAVGDFALRSLTTTWGNTAVGPGALFNDATGNDNTAVGKHALYYNTAAYNSAFGSDAMPFNTTGTYNTALGVNALSGFTTGSGNTAAGSSAVGGTYPASGNWNTGMGGSALGRVSTGSYNSALGTNALWYLTSGSYNAAVGYQAGWKSTANAVTTSTYSTFVGANAGLGSTNQRDHLTVIGADASGDESNAIVLGRNVDSVWVPGKLRLSTRTPASSSSPCVQGEIAFDVSYVYWCPAANSWLRAPGSKW